MLFSTFHVHAALKLAPILPQNRKKCRWCALSAALPQKQAPFLFRYFNNNNASFQWQFYDQRRRRLYHTLLWHGCRGRWTKGLCKKCGYFLSHRTLKIPSSINKPVPGSKIVGKTEQEKMHEIFESLLTGEHFYCINYMDYHFNVCFFSVQTDALLTG